MGNDHRSGRRANVSIPAEVLVGGRRRSFAWVTNVSQAGARLRCAAKIPIEAPFDLVLHPFGRLALEVRAVVVRAEMNADARSFDLNVRFVETPAPQLDTLALIVGAVQSGVAPAIDRAVIVMSQDTESRHQLAKVTAALGRRPVLLSNPLDAIQWLQDSHTQVDAVIASEDNPDLPEFFTFLAEMHPVVHRVVSAERATHRRSHEDSTPPHAHAVITLPVAHERLQQILRPSGTPGSR